MPDRPNIILIICHDLGQHVGCYGISTVRTPHIDALAKQGVRFENSFCVAPQCSPSRASLFTGRYPQSNGVLGLVQPPFSWELHPEERHLAGVLREAGYRTARIGTQHETWRPDEMGFDEIHTPKGRCRGIARTTAEWVRQKVAAEAPFYVQVGFPDPHRAPYGFASTADKESGITVPGYLVDDIEAREEFAYFQGAVKNVDDAVGVILEGLEDSGLAGDTIVIFTTDHGIPFPRAKCSLYDPGIQVCLIMRQPGGDPHAGSVFKELVSNVDVFPTLLEIVGVPVADNVQGRSFAPLLSRGPYEPRHEVFAQMTYHGWYNPMRCIRTESHKLIVNFISTLAIQDPSQQWRPRTVTKEPFDPSRALKVPVELHDLKSDPLEFNNLADSAAHRSICCGLLNRLHQWMVKVNDPLLKGIPPPPAHKVALNVLEKGILPVESSRRND